MINTPTQFNWAMSVVANDYSLRTTDRHDIKYIFLLMSTLLG
jgi:hypothetical protein